MQDQFARSIEYLRISLTDRCNLRCSYCMPSEGINWLPHGDILSYEEVLRLVRISIELGFKKFRITGGEPLVRKGVLDFLEKMNSLPGVEDLAITSNGVLLAGMATELKRAGVKRVNISLDTLDERKFTEISGGGRLKDVLAGIEKSLEVGLAPVKVNAVVMRRTNDDELEQFAQLARDYPLHIRFIELMPIGASNDKQNELVTIAEMQERLKDLKLISVQNISGAGPANYFTAPGLKGSIGFISALSQHFCGECNRVRLTADGKLKPCLHSKDEYDLRTMLRNDFKNEQIKQKMAEVIWSKPSQHFMRDEGWNGRKRSMSQIGG